MSAVPNENPAPVGLFGPNGLPTHYDYAWQTYTNLTSAQMAWFRSQPQWLAKYCTIAHWHREIDIIDNQLKMPYQDASAPVTIPDPTITFPLIMTKIAAVRQSMASILATINAPNSMVPGAAGNISAPALSMAPITTTDQIDAAIAALPQ